MSKQLDWARYTRWTWILVLLAAIVLLWMWLTGRGPGAAGGCCSVSPAAITPAMPVVPPVAAPAAPRSVANKATWDGSKLTLEGSVPTEAVRKTVVDAAAAKYGAGNVIDRLTIDPAATGPVTIILAGSVASEAVKAARGDEARAWYVGATVDNQLAVVAAPSAPAAVAKDVQCGDRVAVAATFASGSSQLTADARKLLDAVVPCINGEFEVGGHTDNVGQPAANQTLSERRAQAVAAYLVSKGVGARLLSIKGYGDTAPIGDNTTAEGKSRNRRIEFKKM
jgi:OmpA-OmpF porin, OOP family